MEESYYLLGLPSTNSQLLLYSMNMIEPLR